MFQRIKKIYLIGIGGSGMSGIAEVLLKRGYTVSGSDLAENEAVKRLKNLGAKIAIGHSPDNLIDPDVVVVSTAVSAQNPEVVKARELHIPVIPRAEMLTELMRMQYGIAVAGAHGKTTTTSLILSVLQAAGKDPTGIVGGRVNSIGSNATLGKGELIVVEADESDGSFLRLTPTLAVITNIDREHLNHYGSMDALREAFVQFANSVPFYGAVICCAEDAQVRALLPAIKRRVVTYGIDEPAHIRGEILGREGLSTLVAVRQEGRLLGKMKVPIPGEHNVCNALAAVAIGLECDISFEKIIEGLALFSGIHRRMEQKGETNGIMVLDDYGHHPCEIRATLKALRDVYEERRLVVVFQPHRYSRLKDLFEEFADAFTDAEALYLLPVYPAGEAPLAGIDSARLAEKIRQKHKIAVFHLEDKKTAVDTLRESLQTGDILLTLGAGDVWKLGMEYLAH